MLQIILIFNSRCLCSGYTLYPAYALKIHLNSRKEKKKLGLNRVIKSCILSPGDRCVVTYTSWCESQCRNSQQQYTLACAEEYAVLIAFFVSTSLDLDSGKVQRIFYIEKNDFLYLSHIATAETLNQPTIHVILLNMSHQNSRLIQS